MSQQTHLGRRATTVSTDQTHTVITYHNTQVVRFNADEIILNTGGYKTATTKTRMNQAANQYGLGFLVKQMDFEWYVEFDDDTMNPIPFTGNTLTLKR